MTSTTRNRFGTFGSGNGLAAAEQSRISHGSSNGPSLGNASGAWNNGGIWGNSTIGSGLKNNSNENARFPDDRSAITSNSETMTGSGSLLSNSESDSWGGHQRTLWKSNDDTSLGLTSASTKRTGTSPMRRQNSSQRVPQTFTEMQPTSGSFFSVTPGAPNQALPKASQKRFLDPTSGSFAGSGNLDSEGYQRSSRHNSDEENRYNARSMGFGNNDALYMAQLSRQNTQGSASAFSSSVPSRSGSLPPSRSGVDASQRFDADIQHTPFTHVGRQNGGGGHRPDLSISRTAGNYSQRFNEHPSPTTMAKLSDDFAKMGMAKENYDTHREAGYSSQNVSSYEFPQQADSTVGWDFEDSVTRDGRDAYGQYNLMPLQQHSEYRNAIMNASYSHSPTSSDARRSQYSPNYSTNGGSPYLHQNRTSSRGSHHGNVPARQALLLDQKLRGLQQEQQSFIPPHTNPLPFRNPYIGQYEVHLQNARLNTLAPYYPIQAVPNFLPSQAIPRGPAKDQDASQHMRSQCLEEFRSNSKTNKRYELKDIYNHIVEFSGDQHGSRFIQQKLETANSDEKDQVFREILPNAMQLMTDVFGNYVIQKFFEHGNQSQKKTIANQMKNHVLTLSLQMYGCRVVQKALEHILTDQQASLIRELQKDNQIMKCVKDQNGNHVIQKAIERIPAEHIQFIVNAFTGQVYELSKHAYGCRVIQRMLEHCVEPTRTALLQELHGCAHNLIGDTYGNYVTQHVIEHGREEDRNRIISLVTANLLEYSKHKFASNVVETCVKFGNVEQRKMIVDIITAVNEKGESKLQYLIRDQYCNYVIQKLLTELKGAELDGLVDILKAQMVILKRFAFGKQIQAIDRLLYSATPQQSIGTRSNSVIPPPIDTSTSAAPSPPLLTGDGQSPQSSSVPSTNASSVGGPTGSRKSSASNAIEVMTPTST